MDYDEDDQPQFHSYRCAGCGQSVEGTSVEDAAREHAEWFGDSHPFRYED